jgi:capsid protein
MQLQFAPGAQSIQYHPGQGEVSWTTPAREMIDPAKEVPAARDAVKAGFKSISEVIRSQGYNPD